MTPSPAQGLVADLGTFLTGRLSRLSQGIGVGPRSGQLDVDAILAPTLVAAQAESFERRHGASDRRAIFSIWALRQFQAVLPPLLIANIVFDRSPVLEIERLAFVLSPEFAVEEMIIGPDVVDLGEAPGVDRFHGLARDFLAPLIERISVRTTVTERVLWSNAGTTFDGLLALIEPMAGERRGFREARALLQAPSWPDGAANRLFSPVRYQDGRRIRRICCLRYLVPDERLCAICPLDPNHRARRFDEDAVVRRDGSASLDGAVTEESDRATGWVAPAAPSVWPRLKVGWPVVRTGAFRCPPRQTRQ